MKWLNNLSISRKLMLIIMATSAAVLLLASAAYMLSDRVATERKLVYLVTSQAELVGANSSAALAFSDLVAAKEALDSLNGQDHIVSATLYDREGKVFARYLTEAGAISEHPAIRSAQVATAGNILRVQQPIYLDNERIGSIVLKADVKRLYARLGDVTSVIIMVLLITLLAALAISARVHRSVSVPVKNLASVARRVSKEQDYTVRAEKRSNDEIGELVDGINEMLAQIQQRDDMLAKHASTLEKKVEERTDELHRLTEQFRHRAYHDELTGLPNRALFEDRLSHAVETAHRSGARLAVLFLDLDRFKPINDTLGHAVGDKLLKHIGDVVSGCLRKEDTIARLGGDEFIVLLENVDTTEVVGRTAQKIINEVQQPVSLDGHDLQISTSIGISLFPDDATDPVTLMRYADSAMYLSKDEGRNDYHFHTESMHASAMKRMNMENDMQMAVTHNDLVLAYLPKFDMNGSIAGVEALLRWNHPEEGQMLPGEFLQVADESGLIQDMGDWAIEASIRQLKTWDDAGSHVGSIAINLTGRQLMRPGIAARLMQLLRRYEIDAQRVELEFSERILSAGSSQAIANLNDLSNIGVMLSVDDFCSELGSMNYVHKLPISIIKVGRELIDNVDTKVEQAAIIRALIVMAHELGMKVVAKAVETQTEYEFLREAGCDQVQGYYLSEPIDNDAVSALLAKQGG